MDLTTLNFHEILFRFWRLFLCCAIKRARCQEFILLCCSEKKQASHVALFNLLGHMFLTIKIVLNEPLDGAVKSNFDLSNCLCKTIFLLKRRESGNAGTPSY